MTDPHLRYPIGQFQLPTGRNADLRLTYTKQIGALPTQFRTAAAALQKRTTPDGTSLLDQPYRPGGWTARQVIHHVADSHLNAVRRLKRTLTEDHPTLGPYDEQRWAELPDVQAVPIEASLQILEGLHLRWAVLLSTLTDAQWDRTAYHPGSGWTYHTDTLAAHYAWHGRHHLGHLRVILGQQPGVPS